MDYNNQFEKENQEIAFQKFFNCLQELKQCSKTGNDDFIIIRAITHELEKSYFVSKKINGTYSQSIHNDKFPRKEFTTRESMFTNLFRTNKHLKSVHNLFIGLFVTVLARVVIYDLLETGKVDLATSLIQKQFRNFNYAFTVWLYMFISVILVHFAFRSWAHLRTWNNFKTKDVLRIWDRFWLSAYIIYQVLFLIGFCYFIKNCEFSFTLSIVLYVEQIRLIMKTHAFVRSSIPKILFYQTEKSDKKDPKNPTRFSNYLYFLFVPTLIYRDNYPRTKEINWQYFLSNLLETIAVIFLSFNLMNTFIIPPFKDYGLKYYDKKTLIYSILKTTFPMTLNLLSIFYLIMHTWPNMFAEILQFGDRKFYTDWWNTTTSSEYFRRWNIVVHDWCYEYIYLDLKSICAKHSVIPKTTVFLLSAIFHEYILGFSIGLLFPLLTLIIFGSGYELFFAKITKKIQSTSCSRAISVLLWILMFNLHGAVISFYMMEYFSRQNCTPETDSNLPLLFRLFYCNKNEFENKLVEYL